MNVDFKHLHKILQPDKFEGVDFNYGNNIFEPKNFF